MALKDSQKYIWEEKFKIRSYEVDMNSKATLQTICYYIQESTRSHARSSDFGYEDMIDKNLLWVLSRLKIKILSYPKWDEIIYIQTWTKGTEKLFAFRDFNILNAQKDIIGSIGSSWLLLDLNSHRPQRLTQFSNHYTIIPGKHAVESNAEKLPSLENPEINPVFSVRYSDLDQNKHVNNVKYIEWILDSYTIEHRRLYDIVTFEINFLGEAVAGDDIFICTEKIPGEKLVFLNSAIRKNDNKEVCRSRILWQKPHGNNVNPEYF